MRYILLRHTPQPLAFVLLLGAERPSRSLLFTPRHLKQECLTQQTRTAMWHPRAERKLNLCKLPDRISNDSKWGSRLVNWIMLDKYYSHTLNLGCSPEKNPTVADDALSMRNIWKHCRAVWSTVTFSDRKLVWIWMSSEQLQWGHRPLLSGGVPEPGGQYHCLLAGLMWLFIQEQLQWKGPGKCLQEAP